MSAPAEPGLLAVCARFLSAGTDEREFVPPNVSRMTGLWLLCQSCMDGVCVIVAYRPKPGKEKQLLDLVRSRIPTLRREGLVTDRKPVIMRARDGTIIEVSEWKSHEAIDAAHKNPNVLAMWDKFFVLCDCVPLSTLAEASDMFAGFEPIDE